jgi:hypothetical protein
MKWLLAALLAALPTSALFANHGPGTSGGGSATASGETLKEGHFDLSLREDYTQFEDINAEHAERIALKSGEFDALRSAFIISGSGAYGITEDFRSARRSEVPRHRPLRGRAGRLRHRRRRRRRPARLTDLWLQGEYRFVHNELGSLALIPASSCRPATTTSA